MKQVGILYHAKFEKAKAFSHELEKFLSAQGISFWLCSAWDEEQAKPQVAGSDLILSIGGDGTILRAAGAVVPRSVPSVGTNLGNLGFITELKATEALDKLRGLLGGEGWIEERVTCPPKTSPVIMLVQGLERGKHGQENLHARTDHQ